MEKPIIDLEELLDEVQDMIEEKIAIEGGNFDDFEERVKSRGDRWDDDINLWSGYNWEDYGKEMLDCCGYNIPDHILDFIDLERYGRYCGEEYLQEYSEGLIEIQ